MHKYIKIFLDMFPLLIFYFSNSKGYWLIENFYIFSSFNKPIYPATIIFSISIIFTILLYWILFKKISLFSITFYILTLFMSLLTIIFKNDTFIKIKPTIVNSIMSIFLFCCFFLRKNFLEKIFPSFFILNKKLQRKLILIWAYFFLLLAILNEIIWRNFNDQFWITFKVFGIFIITTIFCMIQIYFIVRNKKNRLNKL